MVRSTILCFTHSCVVSIAALSGGIEKKQILSVVLGLSYESFPKNEPLAQDWWGLENGLYFLLYLLTMKFTAGHTKRAANGDLFPQDRGHYIFSCSLDIFLKFILRNPSSVIEC